MIIIFTLFHILCVKNTCDNMLKTQQKAKTKIYYILLILFHYKINLYYNIFKLHISLS